MFCINQILAKEADVKMIAVIENSFKFYLQLLILEYEEVNDVIKRKKQSIDFWKNVFKS